MQPLAGIPLWPWPMLKFALLTRPNSLQHSGTHPSAHRGRGPDPSLPEPPALCADEKLLVRARAGERREEWDALGLTFPTPDITTSGSPCGVIYSPLAGQTDLLRALDGTSTSMLARHGTCPEIFISKNFLNQEGSEVDAGPPKLLDKGGGVAPVGLCTSFSPPRRPSRVKQITSTLGPEGRGPTCRGQQRSSPPSMNSFPAATSLDKRDGEQVRNPSMSSVPTKSHTIVAPPFPSTEPSALLEAL